MAALHLRRLRGQGHASLRRVARHVRGGTVGLRVRTTQPVEREKRSRVGAALKSDRRSQFSRAVATIAFKDDEPSSPAAPRRCARLAHQQAPSGKQAAARRAGLPGPRQRVSVKGGQDRQQTQWGLLQGWQHQPLEPGCHLRSGLAEPPRGTGCVEWMSSYAATVPKTPAAAAGPAAMNAHAVGAAGGRHDHRAGDRPHEDSLAPSNTRCVLAAVLIDHRDVRTPAVRDPALPRPGVPMAGFLRQFDRRVRERAVRGPLPKVAI